MWPEYLYQITITMNPNIYFITESEIKSGTTLFDNVEWKSMQEAVKESQKYVLNIIGTGMYNELESQISTSALTVNNSTLLYNYIHPVIKHYFMYETVEDIHFKYSPTGVQIMAPMDSRPATLSELDRAKAHKLRKAERAGNELRLFLLANYAAYPLYINPGSAVDTVHPSQRPYFSGLFLGDSSGNYSVDRDVNL